VRSDDTPAGIREAVTEALDAIGDDPAYEHARTALAGALTVLRDGTTAEAHTHLTRALQLIDEACPDFPEETQGLECSALGETPWRSGR